MTMEIISVEELKGVLEKINGKFAILEVVGIPSFECAFENFKSEWAVWSDNEVFFTIWERDSEYKTIGETYLKDIKSVSFYERDDILLLMIHFSNGNIMRIESELETEDLEFSD